MKRLLNLIMFIAMLVMLVVLGGPAGATDDSGQTCETIVVVDEAAWTETIPHEGTPSQWWNFSPNDTHGPFVGEPSFPSDPGGTWNGPHTEGGPAGTGTFQPGNGHGDWFHREPGWDAWTQVIEHAAVTHEEQKCEDNDEGDEGDHPGTPTPDPGMCPPGTDHEFEAVPVGTDPEAFCNDVTPPVPPSDDTSTSVSHPHSQIETSSVQATVTPAKSGKAVRPVKAVKAVKVPTVVDAGLSSAPESANYRSLLLLVSGLLVLASAVARPVLARRKR